MNEIINKDYKKGEIQYLDGILNLHKKHMDLLTDLIQRPTIGKEITDITVRNKRLLNDDLIHTELDVPLKKSLKHSEEKTN